MTDAIIVDMDAITTEEWVAQALAEPDPALDRLDFICVFCKGPADFGGVCDDCED